MPAFVEKSLEQKIAEKAAQKTDWDTDKKNWEWVTIPRENSLGEKHAEIILNGKHEFTAGNKYLVPPAVADYITERLAIYARACVRILQPRRDYSAENQVDRFGTARSLGGARDAAASEDVIANG